MQRTLASLRNKAAGKRNGDAYLKRVSIQEKEKEKKQRYTKVKHTLDLLK